MTVSTSVLVGAVGDIGYATIKGALPKADEQFNNLTRADEVFVRSRGENAQRKHVRAWLVLMQTFRFYTRKGYYFPILHEATYEILTSVLVRDICLFQWKKSPNLSKFWFTKISFQSDDLKNIYSARDERRLEARRTQ